VSERRVRKTRAAYECDRPACEHPVDPDEPLPRAVDERLLRLRLAHEDEEAAVADLADPDGDDVHLHHPRLRGEDGAVVVGDALDARVEHGRAHDEHDDVHEQRERREDLQPHQRQVVAHGRRGRVERDR
jgi:hypothetical protein